MPITSPPTLQFIGQAGGTDLTWSLDTNWTLTSGSPQPDYETPGTGDIVELSTSADDTTTTMNYDFTGSLLSPPYPYGLTFLNIDATGTDSLMKLVLSEGFVLDAEGEGVGDNGSGELEQAGGLNAVDLLSIADAGSSPNTRHCKLSSSRLTTLALNSRACEGRADSAPSVSGATCDPTDPLAPPAGRRRRFFFAKFFFVER